METKERRRTSKRYPVAWEATVVFEKANGTLVVQAQTQNISNDGASILSDHADLAGSMVTLVIATPSSDAGNGSRTIKARARVVSSIQGPSPPGFRHCLNFLRSPGDGLEFLEEILEIVAGAAGDKAPDAPAAAPVPAASGRLARLKELAQAKLSEKPKHDKQAEIYVRLDAALERAYRYFKDLAEQLNIVKPTYSKGYVIVGVPEFTNLAWESGRADLRMRELSPTKKVWERASLNFKLSGSNKIRISRESPASDRLAQTLADNRIEFKARDKRNERGSSAQTEFEFACEVAASVVLEGDFEDGSVLLKARNVERFGMLEHRLVPESITTESLEELAGLILGETHSVGPMLLKGA